MGIVQRNLFSDPMGPVAYLDRPIALLRLRRNGIVVQLRGRGHSTLYVDERHTKAVVCRVTKLWNGRKRRAVKQFGTFTSREQAFVDSLLASL